MLVRFELARGDSLKEGAVGGDGGAHGRELGLGAGGVGDPLQLRARELCARAGQCQLPASAGKQGVRCPERAIMWGGWRAHRAVAALDGVDLPQGVLVVVAEGLHDLLEVGLQLQQRQSVAADAAVSSGTLLVSGSIRRQSSEGCREHAAGASGRSLWVEQRHLLLALGLRVHRGRAAASSDGGGRSGGRRKPFPLE